MMKWIAPLLLVSLLWACGGSKISPESSSGDPAIDALTEKIMADPDNAELYSKRAALYMTAGNFQQAALNYEKAISLDSLRLDDYSPMADAYLEVNNSRKALDALEKVARLDPENPKRLLSLAELQQLLTLHDASLQTLNKILAKDRYDADALFLLGMNFKEMGDTMKAAAAFQTAVEHNSDHVNCYIQLAQLSAENGKMVALTYYDNVLRIDSTSYDALFGKAYFFQTMERYEEALEWYHRATIHHAQEPDVQFNTALVYLALNKRDEALKHLNITAKLEPTNARVYYYTGIVYEQKGEKDKAIKQYQQALNFDANYELAKQALKGLGVN
jgi:tetratricopeptide (TPR) repeat protein